MKKAKRILSFLMAVVIMSSFMSVVASAKAPYKDADIPASQYDDLDKPTFTLNQCSSMVLDFVDKTLKETNDKDGSLVIDLSVLGTLNLTSVDNALNGIYDLLNGALFTIFKGLLGDLKDLKKDAISSARRASTPAASADTNVIYSLIGFLNDNRTILSRAVDGSLDMGLANSFVDLSEINVNQMLKGMLFPMAYPDVTPVPDPVTQTVDQMVQDIIETLLVGTPEEPGLLPALDGHIDIVNSTAVAYDFVEGLLADVYNLVVVPLLNTELKKLVREICGVVYEDAINFPNGDESNLNEYALILDINYVVPVHVFAPGATLVTDINNILYEIIDAVTVSYSGWVAGNNTLALNNLAAALKYVFGLTGGSFFAEYVWQPTVDQINAMNNQELFSYVLRSALNSFIDNMNIPASADTLTEVLWYALKEVCAQYIPSQDYSAQPQTLNGILFMLADYAVYALNQIIDMNPTAAALPGAGLLAYGQGLDATITAIMNYVRTNYGGLFNLTLSSTDGWAALDTLVFSIAQSNWLPASVGGSTKELIVNRILRDILDLNTGNLFALFDHRADSEFATKTVKKVLIDTVARLINVIFPSAMGSYTSFETAFSNAELKGIVERLLASLNTRRTAILPAILPLMTNVMGLSSPQAFANPELLVPNQIGAATSFTINNESTGLNTGATNKAGTFTQDALYKIKIVSLTSSIPAITLTNLVGTVINGGDSVTCNIGGTFTANNVLRITMTYDVYTELGTKLTDVPLTAMAFSYISGVLDDGRNFINYDQQSNNKHTSYYKSLYINQNTSMTALADMQAQIKREKTSAISHAKEVTVTRTAATVNASLVGVTAAPFSNFNTTYDGGTWTFPVFVVDPVTAVRPADGIYSSTFTYFAPKTANTSSNDETFAHLNKSYVVFYDDFDLPGLLSSELNKRRDPTSYGDADAWDTYLDAMRNAVSVVYKPRQASTFMTQIAPAFEAAQIYLAESVTALEASEIAAGVDVIKAALDAVKPSNAGLEYDDPAYNWFGIADYVPYTFLNYEREEGTCQGLYNSQQLPVEPVLPANPTPDQIAAFNTAHAQWVIDYAAAQANMVALKSVDVAYALHRLNLYASRMIRVQAVKARLNEAIAAVGSPDQALYTQASWAAFNRALTFASAVNAESATAVDGGGNFILRQTKVDYAREMLIETYKKLTRVADYTQLLAYIAEAMALTESDWTPESWAVLVTALADAVAVPLQMSNTAANQAIIDAAAAALRAAIDALVAGGDPILPAPGKDTIIDLINGFIFGLIPAEIEGSVIAGPGFTLVFHPGPGGNGTGSYFELVPNGGKAAAPQANLIFTNILYGDVNGDASIDSIDAGMVVDHENYLIDWSAPEDLCYKLAADANDDGSRDSIDAGMIVDNENYIVTIDQFSSRQD